MMKQFLAAKHLVPSPKGREHTLDRPFEENGHHRRVMLKLSHFMSLLAILPNSDFTTAVPDAIAAAVERHIKMKRIELPFRPPVLDVQQYWHRRMQHGPANRWLYGVFCTPTVDKGPSMATGTIPKLL